MTSGIPYSFWHLARWIVACQLLVQTTLFIWAMNGVTAGYGAVSVLSNLGVSLASIGVLWLKRHAVPSSLQPNSFAFRTGVIWSAATLMLALNHWNIATQYADISFLGSKITGTVFTVLVLSVFGHAVSQKWEMPPWFGQLPGLIFGGAFLLELGAALFWLSAPMWFFTLLSISAAISAIMAIWMLQN